MGTEKLGVRAENIRTKKKWAREIMRNLRVVDRVGVERKRELLNEVNEQITICEELMRPLSYVDIEELCKKDTIAQIQNYCHKIKLA